MNYSILTIPPFDKQLKRLSKKYPSIKSDIIELAEQLNKNPKIGTSLGNNCYKIRLNIKSKDKGKSGGARVITNFVVNADSIYLLSVYDKSDKDNLTDKELKELLRFIK